MLAGKVALVTGVSSGLGRAVAIAYVQAGAAVLGVARRRELGEELQAELGTDRFAFIAADISVVAECERAVATAVGRFGTLDILVNNAAVRTSRRCWRCMRWTSGTGTPSATPTSRARSS